jgi:putative redox protein
MIIAISDSQNFKTVFTDCEHSTLADTTPNNGGAGVGFHPHALLEAALATCINISVRMCATREGIPLAAITTRVSLDRSEPDEAVFHHEVELQGDLTADQRAKLLKVASASPVRRTLMRTIRFEDGTRREAQKTTA